MFGKTSTNKQRFKCLICNKTFTWKRVYNKRYREKLWFDLWIKESYSIRQLAKISGHSKNKLERNKNYWLSKSPKSTSDFSSFKYIYYDGTYFGKNNCLICLMDIKTQKIISNIFTTKEGYKNVYPWFQKLKLEGLNPYYIVMDGERSVIRAIRDLWPNTHIQRCLCHIQREGMRWLRTYPKTQAGRELRIMLSKICTIKNEKEQNNFINNFYAWLEQNYEFTRSLPSNNIGFRDLKKTVTLIKNAIPDMFYYIKEPTITSTTNTLESFYSRLKSDYNRHRGLSKKHKINYLKWYCYLK